MIATYLLPAANLRVDKHSLYTTNDLTIMEVHKQNAL